MKSIRPLILALGLILLGALATAQSQPGAEELDLCLATLFNLPLAEIPRDQSFGLQLPTDKSPSVSAEIREDQLVAFQCPRFQVFEDPETHALLITSADGSKSRRLTFAEEHNFRSYLSLNPAWVLRRVQRQLAAFAYSVDPKLHTATYVRQEAVLLSPPEEPHYGTFEEILVVDTATHCVVRYSILALDEDRVPVRDMVNTYEYSLARGPAWVRVTQGGQYQGRAELVYTVLYE
jgi:hypothetical protein